MWHNHTHMISMLKLLKPLKQTCNVGGNILCLIIVLKMCWKFRVFYVLGWTVEKLVYCCRHWCRNQGGGVSHHKVCMFICMCVHVYMAVLSFVTYWMSRRPTITLLLLKALTEQKQINSNIINTRGRLLLQKPSFIPKKKKFRWTSLDLTSRL